MTVNSVHAQMHDDTLNISEAGIQNEIAPPSQIVEGCNNAGTQRHSSYNYILFQSMTIHVE